MHATASNVYPPFVFSSRHQHYSTDINTFSTHYNTNFDLSKQAETDGKDNSLIPSKKRARIVPVEEKNENYYQKRARNNDSAKRSRDARRTKEQDIQERVIYLEHENSRLAMENQAIRYKLSQLRALYNEIVKPLP